MILSQKIIDTLEVTSVRAETIGKISVISTPTESLEKNHSLTTVVQESESRPWKVTNPAEPAKSSILIVKDQVKNLSARIFFDDGSKINYIDEKILPTKQHSSHGSESYCYLDQKYTLINKVNRTKLQLKAQGCDRYIFRRNNFPSQEIT